MCSSIYLCLRDISKIPHKINFATCKMLINALVTSRLDYCNSLLCASPNKQLSRLQKLQNMACHIVIKLGKYDHISSNLKDLHWLKLTEMLEFKVCWYSHQCFYSTAPDYLKYLLSENTSRTLRSSDQRKMFIPYSGLSLVKSGSFSHIVPKLWNQLPNFIRQTEDYGAFKKGLKTFIFRKSHCDAI